MTRLRVIGLLALVAGCVAAPMQAAQIGQIFVCYACANTGDAAIDAALANNPSVSFDGILFAFKNTSGFAITGGEFSISGTSPSDTFTMPTLAAGAEFILMPGISSDGSGHASGALFAHTGTAMDTSDGDGGVNDSSIFKFTGLSNALAVISLTAVRVPLMVRLLPAIPV